MQSWLSQARKAEKFPFIFLFLLYFLCSYKSLGTHIAERYLLREDGFLESLSAIFLLLSSVLLFLTAKKAKSNRQFKSYCFPLLSIAISFFFWFAEEISWGQRILNFSIQSIEDINVQGEITIHNLNIIQPNLHYAYFFVFFIVSLFCLTPTNSLSIFTLMPNIKLFYYFLLPALYYIFGQFLLALSSDTIGIMLEINGHSLERSFIFLRQEAFEFLLALGAFKYSVEKFKLLA